MPASQNGTNRRVAVCISPNNVAPDVPTPLMEAPASSALVFEVTEKRVPASGRKTKSVVKKAAGMAKNATQASL